MKGQWVKCEGMVRLCNTEKQARSYAKHMNRETDSKKYSSQGYAVFKAGKIFVSQGKKTGNIYLHPNTYKDL